jgi:hypothetical protein
MISDGKNGLLVNRESIAIYRAIKYLLDNKEKMRALGEAPVLGEISNKTIMRDIEMLFKSRGNNEGK